MFICFVWQTMWEEDHLNLFMTFMPKIIIFFFSIFYGIVFYEFGVIKLPWYLYWGQVNISSVAIKIIKCQHYLISLCFQAGGFCELDDVRLPLLCLVLASDGPQCTTLPPPHGAGFLCHHEYQLVSSLLGAGRHAQTKDASRNTHIRTHFLVSPIPPYHYLISQAPNYNHNYIKRNIYY